MKVYCAFYQPGVGRVALLLLEAWAAPVSGWHALRRGSTTDRRLDDRVVG